jgi:hypothetical protein
VPAVRVLTENVAVVPVIGTVPKVVVASMNAMDPVAPEGTVAVNVTPFW